MQKINIMKPVKIIFKATLRTLLSANGGGGGISHSVSASRIITPGTGNIKMSGFVVIGDGVKNVSG